MVDFYRSRFERVTKLKIPLEGSRKLFIAYIVSNFTVAIVGLVVVGCDAYMNTVLTGEGTVFYNVTFFLLGILMTIVSLSCYLFVGRYQRLILSTSLYYHFLAKSALTLSFGLLTVILELWI